MVKLYSLEAIEVDDKQTGGLLIDKLIKQHESKKDPVSITAQLLKERQDIKETVVKQLGKDPEEPVKDKEDSEEEPKEDTPEDSEDKEESKEEAPKEEKEDKPKEDAEEGQDVEDVKSLVGSGLKEDAKEDTKEEPSTESFKPRVSLSNLFLPLTLRHSQYKAALETYNLSNEALPQTAQPVAYVKEQIIESLTNLAKVSQNYIDSNIAFKNKTATTLSSLNEKLTVFKALVDANKHSFTNKLISEKEVLSNLGVENKSDIRDTAPILIKYVEQSSKAMSLMFTNDFSELPSSFTTEGFVKDESNTDYTYSKPIPGFSTIRVSLLPFISYLKTKVEDYQYYKIKTLKTEDIFNLNAITITKDKDLVYILESLDKLLINISLTTDNLSSITDNFSTFIENIKATIFDLKEDKYSSMTEINIDQKLKDFIKFKIGVELSYINVNTMMDYMTTVITVINECVELKS